MAFSERVAGVDVGDFVLSPDDIRESKRFVHTKAPSLPIPDGGTAVSDAITVSRSGAVRTMSVYVDISHVHTDELGVHLVAPDGTVKTLHSRAVFFCDRWDLDFFDICGTYKPDFFGASVTGDWLLRISDYEQGYTGTLNEWVLDIEYDDLPSAVTGSGSRYTVTLEAASDGIYNVDLAPDNGIADMTGNPLDGADPVGEDQSYIVDSAAPAVVSIERGDPAGQSAAAGYLPFHVTFSELVTGVSRGDFVLSPDSPETGKVISLTNSRKTYIMETGQSDDPSSRAQRIPLASQFIVTVEAISGGTYNLDVAAESGIADMTGNPLDGTAPTGADQSYIVSSPLSVDAGADQTVREGSTVTLDGTVTYTGGGQLTYQWTHDSTLDITIANAATHSPSFTAPAVATDATVTFTLTVDDGTHASSDSVGVLIEAEPNSPPVLEAIPAQQVDELSVMAFTAVATDADLPADTLTCWLEGAPAGAAMDPATGEFTWTPAEHQDGVHAFTVTVSDGRGGTDSQGVQITVNEVNSPPAADAGADQTVMEGNSVTLAGTADDDGDAMTYTWTHDSALDIAFNGTSPTTTFEAPEVDEDTVVSFTLAVSDGAANSTDTVEITVRDEPDDSDFVTTWETGGPGESVTVPARGTYTVDWGDGTVDADVSGIQTHTYDAAGSHTVRISKGITGFHLDGHPDAGKLRSVDQWGDVEWVSMRSSFKGASSMVLHATDVPDLSRVTDMKNMFKNAQSFDGDISGWDVSGVTNMAGMLLGASSFDSDISAWDVSSVVKMSDMFRRASSFNGDVSAWDVSSVTDMHAMFYRADAFDQNLGPWYIVLDDASVYGSSVPGEVGRITAQNRFLDGQDPQYAVGSGGDSDHFEIDGDSLRIKSVPGRAGPHTVNITSTGSYGDSNSLLLEVVVLDGSAPGGEPETGPREIGGLALSGTNPRMIHVSWDEPGEAPKDYRIKWAKVGAPYLKWWKSSGNAFPTGPSHVITGLEEGEEYKVQVRARYHSGGPGPWSGELIFSK